MDIWRDPFVKGFSCSLSFGLELGTPDSSHQLISTDYKNWVCLMRETSKMCFGGGPQDRFEKHWSKAKA